VRRALLNLLTAGSLVLCAGVALLWVWSYRRSEAIALERWSFTAGWLNARIYGVGINRGRVGVFWISRDTPMRSPPAPQWQWLHASGEELPSARHTRAGFYAVFPPAIPYGNGSVAQDCGAGAPAWALVLALGTLPALRYWRHRRRPPPGGV